MAIDVVNEVVIARPQAEVAAYAMEASNDAVWIRAIKEASVEGGRAVEVGARVARRASLLGRPIRYVYEVVELQPGRDLDMRSVAGPFAMATRYEFEDA